MIYNNILLNNPLIPPGYYFVKIKSIETELTIWPPYNSGMSLNKAHLSASTQKGATQPVNSYRLWYRIQNSQSRSGDVTWVRVADDVCVFAVFEEFVGLACGGDYGLLTPAGVQQSHNTATKVRTCNKDDVAGSYQLVPVGILVSTINHPLRIPHLLPVLQLLAG